MHIDLYGMRRLARALNEEATEASRRADALTANDQARTPHLALASSCLAASKALLDVAAALEARGDEAARNRQPEGAEAK